MADGQLLWRVFDNLLSNAVKYAMPGTRVYLDLTQEEGYATLLFRNISKEELNVPAADLLERFVRGDRSRHSEGSGLGLSIAQSLTELMGGELSLDIDGDLFKVIVTFPKLRTETLDRRLVVEEAPGEAEKEIKEELSVQEPEHGYTGENVLSGQEELLDVAIAVENADIE